MRVDLWLPSTPKYPGYHAPHAPAPTYGRQEEPLDHKKGGARKVSNHAHWEEGEYTLECKHDDYLSI